MQSILHQIENCLQQPRFRYLGKLLLDALLGTLAWEGAALLTPSPGPWAWDGLRWGGLALATSLLLRLPRQQYRVIGFRDILRLGWAGLWLMLFAIALARFPLPQRVGLDTAILAVLLTLLGWASLRAAWRIGHELQWGSRFPEDFRRTLIVGAGRAGVLVAEELDRHPELGSRPIGYVDDDLSKHGVFVHGIPVLGPQERIADLVQKERIDEVVLAIPSASGRQMRSLIERTRGLEVRVRTVPGIFNLLGSQTWRPELRDLSIEDLLRREPITLDQDSLMGALEDRVVLITGAGGSIGSEVARQVCRFRPQKIILLGRGENSLWAIERELRGAFTNQSIRIELCDIRNRRRLDQAFERWHPEVVFHAAAHKHVPFLELHPEEAIENNVFGTRNVLEACLAFGTTHFVNISTDKAVHPANVLGVSKRIAELLIADASGRTPPRAHYVSVRFGNVLGSRGSVVPIFQEQIRAGGPVTITHPEMTRYFMTIPEASQLVIQAGLLGETGIVYALDMGDPVRIADLARDMIQLHGLVPDLDVELTYTGIRPGEKLHEDVFADGLGAPSHVHPKVFQTPTESLTHLPLVQGLQRLEEALHLPRAERYPILLSTFQDLVPTYQPTENGLPRLIQPRGTHT